MYELLRKETYVLGDCLCRLKKNHNLTFNALIIIPKNNVRNPWKRLYFNDLVFICTPYDDHELIYVFHVVPIIQIVIVTPNNMFG